MQLGPICLFLFLFSLLKGVDPKKILLQFMSKSVLLIFSSKSFIVSGLTFRSLIHSELIFVYGVKEENMYFWHHITDI